MADDQKQAVLPTCWPELIRYRSGLRPSSLTFLGVSDRAPPDRLARLLKTPHAKRAVALLDGLSMPELNHVKTAAEANAEQAEAAFRRTLVFNVTGPVAFVATMAQVAPETSTELLASLDRRGVTTYFILAALALIAATVLYTFVRSRDARDLSDIVRLVNSSRSN